jgi:Zn-dependent peptidase ImmA (M78 family)/DNA-binding XRE family transcriptional regulator
VKYDSSKFQGFRLREAREARALSQVALADLLGVSNASVSQYESGDQFPSAEIMARICERLNLPAHFFVASRPKREDPALFWRALTAANKVTRESHQRRYNWFREVIAVIAEYVEFPRPNFPDFSVPTDPSQLRDEDIDDLATRARQHWGLGDGPISNVVWLVENQGALVVRGEMEDSQRDAYSDWDGRCYVFLGADKGSAVRSRFDLAHEIAHGILHKNVPERVRRQQSIHRLIESQADRFAGAFMLPESSFPSEVYTPSLQSLLHLKTRWRMSVGAMIMRLYQLGIIDDDRRRYLMIQMSRKGWRRREPLDDSLAPEDPRLLKRSLDLLLEHGRLFQEELLRRTHLWPTDIEKLLGLPPGYLAEPAAPFSLQLRRDY